MLILRGCDGGKYSGINAYWISSPEIFIQELMITQQTSRNSYTKILNK